jgi:hypothetical protein
LTEEREGDRQFRLAKETLALFVERGEDLADERHVIHYMYGGNWRAMGAALAELGYQVRPTADEDGLVAERWEVTDEEWARRSMHRMCELAEQYGVEYDGWEASMVRQGRATPPPAKRGLLHKFFKRNR